MGPQPSNLNCKVNQNYQRNQVNATRQFAVNHIKSTPLRDQTDTNETNFPTQNQISAKSPRNELTRATSQRNISSKQSRQTFKPKIFIPQYQLITKVSQTPFKLSIKQKKFYVQQKLKTLGQIVQTRYNTSKHFPYSQILGLTQTLVYSLAYLTKKKCNHHDFYPTNIYYIDGKFKIINPLQLQASGFYLTCQRQRFSFLSPQLIIAILQQTSEKQVGEQIMNKGDVFATGMILLQLCSLQPSSQCYDAESYNIVDSIIKDRIAKVSKVYTPNIAQCINMMLQYQVQKRIDPMSLAQLIHLKIQNQKLLAQQMQAPKNPRPPQVNAMQQIPPNGKVLPPQILQSNPNLMPPMVNRGPPPPPYTKQPFKMQNINSNLIAVPVPNQVYARISPNNQGFLSSSSLQQKLRVIQTIRQNPHEQDSQNQGQFNNQIRNKVQHENRNLNINPNNLNIKMQNQTPRPQYPFVESIYSQKPLYTESQNQSQERLMQNRIKNQKLQNDRNQNIKQFNLQRVPFQRRQPEKSYQKDVINKNLYAQINIAEQKEQIYFTNDGRVQEERKVYRGQIKQLPQQYRQINQQIMVKTPMIYQQRQDRRIQNVMIYNQQPVVQNINIEVPNREKPKQPYSFKQNLPSPKNSPYLPNNVYTNPQINKEGQSFSIESNSSSNSGNSYSMKYGTSFQNSIDKSEQQSLEQRVQRVLNMSRNVK